MSVFLFNLLERNSSDLIVSFNYSLLRFFNLEPFFPVTHLLNLRVKSPGFSLIYFGEFYPREIWCAPFEADQASIEWLNLSILPDYLINSYYLKALLPWLLRPIWVGLFMILLLNPLFLNTARSYILLWTPKTSFVHWGFYWLIKL